MDTLRDGHVVTITDNLRYSTRRLSLDNIAPYYPHVDHRWKLRADRLYSTFSSNYPLLF